MAQKKQQVSDPTCPAFGRYWNPNVDNCDFCKKEYTKEHDECRELTMARKLGAQEAEPTPISIETEDDNIIVDDGDEEPLVEEKEIPLSKEQPVKMAPSEKGGELKIVLPCDFKCEFRDGSKNAITYKSMYPKLGQYDKKALIAKISEETGLTTSEVGNNVNGWINPSYRPKWMEPLEIRDGKVCKV